ncbi:hypothetical protein [Parabacteroides sp. AM08-6]|uniref:hypothetical protein n=1 Tax=Parabacteroides sp. AM08-6 TaxID=2292053 RepID=UPI000EFE418F|nr:hypothetical protein [Parabacteroides sp. AM08-6]RHJ76377.1 hypothetical protein DW103_16815 [Parabacteroides sp. AM08-6]
MKLVFLITFWLTSLVASAQTLLLFGGKDHDEFLGCINCNGYSSNSVWNEYSNYGNSYNSKSIWNEYGTYGNEYSDYSPWNPYATHPPVVVDRDGNFYGYLTTNKYHPKRATFKLALIMYKYYEDIRDNVSEWEEELF